MPNPNYREHLRDERNHMEGLLNQRFNFFIIIFGFIVAAIPYVKNATQLRFVFIVGFIIELAFVFLIGRAKWRLKINMDMLDEIGHDPTTHIRYRARTGCRMNPFRFSVVNLMGYYIPILITVVLLISIFCADCIYDFFE